MKKPFVTLDNITIRLGEKFIFENTSFILHQGENWLITGPNGSGKTTLVKAIAGILPLKQGEILLNFLKDEKLPYPSVHRDAVSYLSFDSHQHISQKDNLIRDLQEFSGKKILGISVKEYLGRAWKKYPNKIFDIENLLNREIATLSTGEQRKTIIIKALLNKPKLLILDEPFDGLDKESKQILIDLIKILEKKMHLIIVTHKTNEVLESITHVMKIKDGKIESFGTRDKFGENNLGLFKNPTIKQKSPVYKNKGKTVVNIKNLNIKMNKKIILKNINWVIREGENWAVIGPNGSGKSTLLKIILGEHVQVYGNEVEVFGKRLGAGFSVWDIKEHMTFISSELLVRYDKKITGLKVVLSGFFDSIGLYQKPSSEQLTQAQKIIEELEMEDLTTRNFNELSFGQKKILLIARALVKTPKLLILDEPLHGLDAKNRKRVLRILEKITQRSTNIIYVTHNEEEFISTINRRLYLNNGEITALV